MAADPPGSGSTAVLPGEVATITATITNNPGQITNGLARQANGVDAFWVAIDVLDADGNKIPGLAGEVELTLDPTLGRSGVAANGDGGYAVALVSPSPGLYEVQIAVGEVSLATPLRINFIGVDPVPSAMVSEEIQTLGRGFWPGEKVSVKFSDLGEGAWSYTADEYGNVPAVFTVPAGAQPGATYAVAFQGEQSGTTNLWLTIARQYLVTFDADGGTPPTSWAQVREGDPASPPADPTKDGFTFQGWYTEPHGAGDPFDASAPVTGDTTVYAWWVPASEPPDVATLAAALVDELGSQTNGRARLADGLDAFTLIIIARDADGNAVVGLGDDLTVVVPPEVTASQVVDQGDGSYTVLLTSLTFGTHQIQAAVGDITLAGPIPINFLSAEATTPAYPGDEVTSFGRGFMPGETVFVTVLDLEEQPTAFTASGDGFVPRVFTVPTSAQPWTTYRIVFEGELSGQVAVEVMVSQLYRVTFDAAGGQPVQTLVEVRPGSPVELPADPTREGFTFQGWFTEPEGQGVAFHYLYPLTGDLTVYAWWAPVPEPEAASITATADQDPGQQTHGRARWAIGYDPIVITITVRDTEGASMAGLADQLSVVVPAEVTAGTVVDTGDGTYTVELVSSTAGVFQVQVGLGELKLDEPVVVNFLDVWGQETVVAGDEIRLMARGFLPDELVFVWIEELDHEVGHFTALETGQLPLTFTMPASAEPGGPYTLRIDGEVSGRVVWGITALAPPMYRVTFDSAGGLPAGWEVAVQDGDTVDLPPDPVRDGFVFKGWYTEPEGAGAPFSADTPVTGDLALYAWWAPVPSQVTPPTIEVASATQLSGQGEPGGAITVTWPSGSTSTARVTGAGAWSVKPPAGAGSGTVVVRQVAGGVTLEATSVFPTVGEPVVTLVSATEVAGTGQAGASITLTWPDGSTSTAKVTGAGKWSVKPPAGLGPGPLVVRQTSGGLTAEVTVDFAGPAAPTITAATASGISGTGEPGAAITVVWPNGSTTTTKVTGAGKWSVKPPKNLVAGLITVRQQVGQVVQTVTAPYASPQAPAPSVFTYIGPTLGRPLAVLGTSPARGSG
jgi:uncharacterized repeat protein (TIGR02543 family)